MTYKMFRYQDDAHKYLQEVVNKYVMEHYNPILTKEYFYEMFVIGDIGFSFSTYAINGAESFLTFKANRVHYKKYSDSYYLDSRVKEFHDSLECGYFKSWDDAFYKEVFAFVDKVIAKANELAPRGYSYFKHPAYKEVK